MRAALDRLAAALLVLTVLTALFVCAAGCRHRPAPSGLLKVDEAWTATEQYGDLALSKLHDAKGKMGRGDARVKVEQAAVALGPDGQKRVIQEGRKATGVATDQYAASQRDLEKIRNNRWVKAALALQRLFWTVLIAGGILTLFGFAANAAGFAWGSKALKGIGAVIFGVLSGGVTFIKTASMWVGTKTTGQKRVTLPEATANVAVAKVKDAKRNVIPTVAKVPIPADPPPRGVDLD
jgi:hypothetical protein